MIEKALKTALTAHKGQLDKSGQPYILHPIRVMLKMSTEVEMVVAILHDVLEDSELTASGLRSRGFTTEVVKAVVALTKMRMEGYEEFIGRIKENPIARKVKIADLEDNMNLQRLAVILEADFRRTQKYHKALQFLKGNNYGGKQD